MFKEQKINMNSFLLTHHKTDGTEYSNIVFGKLDDAIKLATSQEITVIKNESLEEDKSYEDGTLIYEGTYKDGKKITIKVYSL